MSRAELANSRSVLGILLFMPFFIALVLLINFKGETFESAIVFFIIGIAGLVFAYMAKTLGVEPFKWLTGSFDKGDLKWIGIGYVGLFASVFLITSVMPGAIGILVALGVGGVILAYTLIKTETIIVPWIIHAAYNITVVALAGGFFSSFGFAAIPLNSSPIFVPSFGFDLNDANNLTSQAFLQFFGTAFAEEIMKVSIALGVAMLVTKHRPTMWAISVTLWVIAHMILSYRI